MKTVSQTAEFVSLGHPDKTADYISSAILDYLIERDPDVKFAVEVMIKDNTVVLGGEVRTDVPLPDTLLTDLVVDALHQIGYTQEYANRWGEHAINPDKIKIINLLGKQSGDIHQGVVGTHIPLYHQFGKDEFHLITNNFLQVLQKVIPKKIMQLVGEIRFCLRWQKFCFLRRCFFLPIAHIAREKSPSKKQNFKATKSDEIGEYECLTGWGDQGVFVGYACKGDGQINPELFLARKLCHALYYKALGSDNLGLDIKTQITLNGYGHVDTAIVAIPMLEHQDLTTFIVQTLGCIPNKLIVNGTGTYKTHSSIADCGITGRKLACDFYSTACPIGGGSPWTKDPSKADLTLNVYARQLAMEHLADNEACFVYLSSCIGRSELPSAVVKTIKDGKETITPLEITKTPAEIITLLGLKQPVFVKLCRIGLI